MFCYNEDVLHQMFSSLQVSLSSIAMLLFSCLLVLSSGYYVRGTSPWERTLRSQMLRTRSYAGCLPCKDAYQDCKSQCVVIVSNLPQSYKCYQDCKMARRYCLVACQGWRKKKVMWTVEKGNVDGRKQQSRHLKRVMGTAERDVLVTVNAFGFGCPRLFCHLILLSLLLLLLQSLHLIIGQFKFWCNSVFLKNVSSEDW